MGARIAEENGDCLPLRITGGRLTPLVYRQPVASAQVKSALLFAGLVSGVEVRVTEPTRSRDHTERLLEHLGLALTRHRGTVVLASGARRVKGFELDIPGDASSAAFLVAAAVLAEGGALVVESVGINPTRTGFLRVLDRMGAAVGVENRRTVGGEPVGDLVARPASLSGAAVTGREVPSLIDEVPILAVLAARARGESRFESVGELRVKESDRLALLARNLRAVGVRAEAEGEALYVEGTERPPVGRVDTAGDHRLVMAFAVLGTVPGARIELSERASAAVSFPGFFDALARIRA
jgi:3-phosphoshikimate 1-carboxyvinyltransferase